uniref:Protein FAM136A n=1 Tax=Picea sitchensis TaxID=3332 RepID=A9NZB3_PICSI|nr:unknown [Picea sitchensis]
MSYDLEQQIFQERMMKIGNEVNEAVQQQLSGVQDHVNFTLQKAYFKCAYDCFDRTRSQNVISNCVERCSGPVVRANNVVENEMAKFQERLTRSLMVCQDRLEAAKLSNQKEGAMKELESCIDHTVKEHIQTLPNVVERVKLAIAKDGNQ